MALLKYAPIYVALNKFVISKFFQQMVSYNPLEYNAHRQVVEGKIAFFGHIMASKIWAIMPF